MAHIIFDLEQLYHRQFGSKPVVPKETASSFPEAFKIDGTRPNMLSTTGSALTADYRGQEIWLPVKFFGLDVNKFGTAELLMAYSVISLSTRKHIVETPMVERQGTVIEHYSTENTQIKIKGFLIGYDNSGKYPQWPEKELKLLNTLYVQNESLQLDNALTNDWIGTDHKVVIKELDLPPVEGGRKHVRPFSMSLTSDTIFTLEL